MAEVCGHCNAGGGNPRKWKRCTTLGCPRKNALCGDCWSDAAKGKAQVEFYCPGCSKTSILENKRILNLPKLTLIPILLFALFVPGYVWKAAGMWQKDFTWWPDLSHMTKSFVLFWIGLFFAGITASCSFCVFYPVTMFCRRLGYNINFT